MLDLILHEIAVQHNEERQHWLQLSPTQAQAGLHAIEVQALRESCGPSVEPAAGLELEVLHCCKSRQHRRRTRPVHADTAA